MPNKAEPIKAPEPLSKGLELRIMPLGASITNGIRSSHGNGYREELFRTIAKNGNKLNMVGTQSNGTMKDNNNEGHPGYTIDAVFGCAKEAVPKMKPNVVLINLGTNDAIQNKDVDHAGERMEKLINYLYDTVKETTVILSALIPNKNKDHEANVVKINKQFVDLYHKLHGQKKRIVYVDMHGPNGPKVEDITDDGTHPNDEGYKKMAALWYKALQVASYRNYISKPEEVK